MPVQPYVYIDPPAVQPYRHGLFDAAPVINPTDVHDFYGGVEWESLACYASALYPGGLNDVNGAGGVKTLPACGGVTQASAFAVYAGVQAGSVGHTEQEWRDRSRAILDLSAQHAVENALWTGGGGEAPAFNAAGTTKIIAGQAVAADAVDMLTGLGLAEGWLADNYAGVGLLHVAREAYPFYSYLQQLKHDDASRLLTTRVGTRWAFGAGYDNTGPAAAAAPARSATTSYFWMYVTGQVLILEGDTYEPEFGEALDRAGNQVRLYAERPYVAAVDCAKGAILVKSPTIA